MKKLILMFLVLVGGVVQSWATTYTVAGNNEACFGTTWDPANTANDMTLTSGTIYTLVKENVTFTEETTTLSWKVCEDHGWNTSYGNNGYDITTTFAKGTYDIVFVFDSNEKTPYVRSTSTSVDLRGIWGSWNTTPTALTRTAVGTYTGTLDLSKTINDQGFKLVIDGNDWKGTDQLDITDNGLVEGGENNGDNLLLKNSNKDYKTYDVTALWNPITDRWTLTVKGATERTNEDYSVTFVKGRDWSTVNAYVYSELGDNKDYVSDWPGTEIEKTGTVTADNGLEYDVYTYSFKSYFVPEKIIFNDGTNQTANLTFTNESQYTETVPTEVYAAVGGDTTGNQDDANAHKAIFSGYWDSNSTTDYMTLSADGKTYTFTKKSVVLEPMTIYAKVIKKATTTETENITWYPDENETVVIPVPGVYNVTVSMNLSNSTVSIAYEKISEKIEIGPAGWATTVTNSALDFSETGIKAYTATVEGSKVKLTEVPNVQAETGLVLKGTAGDYYVPVIGSSETDKGSLLYSSIYSYDTHEGYNFYGLALKDNGNVGFAQIDRTTNGEVTIPARKAFLKLPSSTSARELDVEFSNGTTGISEVKGAKVAAEGCYNLAGQRVAQPAKGLYIIGGKKVIVK